MAFARYFPGAQALTKFDLSGYISGEPSATLIVEKRIFTRLTAHASWRNEYVLRTGLLLSLARGKPADFAGDSVDGRPKPNPSHRLTAQVTYNSNLVTTVTHLHASFGSTSRKHLAVIHGTDEGGSACLSDPKKGKVDHWGFVDPRLFSQFVEQFPGEAQYGLGSGEMIGIPNVMSLSQPYGMVYAECFPGGSLYYRSTEEHRGHTLASVPNVSSLELGIPEVYGLGTVCSVWISKNSNIPEISSGLVGILAGSSQGIISAYSLGISSLFESRAERGEVTARWVLSPGVPIIAINVDENFSVKRQRSQRIWAVVLNALGEVYYLSQLPVRPSDGRRKLNALSSERVAWRVGRSVGWKLIEATKRTAKPDPFRESTIDGSYSPRTSWDGMGLSKQQIIAETREIEAFMQRKPKHFRQCCEGWDMRRKLEVDFGASDENGEGEGIIVINCGLEEGHMTSIKRYTRSKGVDCGSEPVPTSGSVPYSDVKPRPGDGPISPYTMGLDEKQPVWPLKDPNLSRRSSATSQDIGISGIDEWRTAIFEIGASKSTQITTVAMDMSTFALLTMQEDPFLTLDSSSEVSTPSFSPQDHIRLPNSPLDIPGQRGRFLAAGTKTGTVIVFNVRDPVSSCKMVDSIIRPVRVIQTDSPEISCLALSALYLVHGGNDGLVQAWDPLASNTEPIRTLNSRFSSRARRRLLQAQSLPGGEGINLFAAGAVFLDPDPTTLRGVVSLGAHLRYWSYNSLATNLYKSNKRRFRRSGRMGNHGPDRYTGTARGTLHDYIANEKLDLEQDKKDKRKEGERLAGRFGLDLLGPGASEEEVLAYATLLSEESAVSDEEKRKISRNNSVHGLNGPLKDGDEAALHFSALYEDEDADLAEAIRLSLQESNLMLKSEFEEDEHVGPAAFTVRYVKARNSSSP
jgi:WD40 repeat protein